MNTTTISSTTTTQLYQQPPQQYQLQQFQQQQGQLSPISFVGPPPLTGPQLNAAALQGTSPISMQLPAGIQANGLQQPQAVLPSVAGASAQSAPAQNPTRQFSLISSGPLIDKTYAIANFMDPATIELKHWQTPVHIARTGTDSKVRKFIQADIPSAPLDAQEHRKKVQKARRNYPFHLEDSAQKNCFNGSLEYEQSNKFEPNQANKYVIFKSEAGKFRVIPCDDWYTFKRESKTIPMPYEEAERIWKDRVVKGGADTKDKDKDKEKDKEKDGGGAGGGGGGGVGGRSIFKNLVKLEEPVGMDRISINATGEIEEEEDEDLLIGKKKRKKDKGEDFDFERDFDTDNKEDKFVVKNAKKPKLSSNAQDIKKMTRKKNDVSDDDEKEFIGIEELLEDATKPKATEKKTENSQQPSNSTATPAAGGGAPAGAATAGTQPNNSKKRTDNGIQKGGTTEKDLENQLREFITFNGRCTSSMIIQQFKPDVKNIGKDAFKKILRKLTTAKKENGETWISLKN